MTTIQQQIETMPDTARVWVYQASRAFSADELQQINTALTQFTSSWAAHGQPLLATYEMAYDQFIILSVDESMHGASGCSIDASVGVIRQIEEAFGVSMLDRTQIAVLQNDQINLYPFNGVKKLVTEGKIAADDVVFNNTVQSVGDWRKSWKQAAAESWMARFFS